MKPAEPTSIECMFYRLVQIILVLLIGISGYIVWLLVYPYPMVTIDSPIPIADYQEQGYHRGDALVFAPTYTKKRNYAHSIISRRIECEDGNLVTMTSFDTSLPLTDEPVTVHSPPMIIPDKVSDGWCWFVFTEEVQVNYFREMVNIDESQRFLVLPN